MTWVVWRQYRYQTAVVGGLLAVLAAMLLISGLHAAAVWHSALTRCADERTCSDLVGSNLSLTGSLWTTLVVATSAVPLLPGLLWGTPLVAHELETGTNQFAWTQSVTKRRWLAVKVGWLLLAAVAISGVVSAFVTWWSGPDHALNADAFLANRFDITDLVPVGYAVLAVALGVCAGTLFRRTIPALAVTLAGFIGLRAFVAQWLRLHYVTAVTVVYRLQHQFVPPGAYLGVSQGILPPVGQRAAGVNSGYIFNGAPMPVACESAQAPIPCLAAHGYRGYLSYQPANRFWAFQGIETGIFVVLALALLAVTFWVIERRDA